MKRRRRGTRFLMGWRSHDPNLAVMKRAGSMKRAGHDVSLVQFPLEIPLCGYYDENGQTKLNLFRRIETCFQYGVRPFVMRYKRKDDEIQRFCKEVARWCNNTRLSAKWSFEDFAKCEMAHTEKRGLCASLLEYNNFCYQFGSAARTLARVKKQ